MIPWAHAAIGYLLWSASTHYWKKRPPGDLEAWCLLLGTQFPDLVDKPLAWTYNVLPSGRSLGHSLLTVLVIFAIGYALSRRWNRTNLVVAFSVGHLSHSLADTYRLLLTGQYEDLGYLLWPLLRAPTSDSQNTFGEYLRELSVSSFIGPKSLIGVLMLVLWVYDGMPGVPSLRSRNASTEDVTDRE
ncbi:metal-dependent hydrolase [Halorarum halophilum]|uniref:Metal-dependent hydrolase n=1 Tax=Halorarum halophilum TaxID=2743090 RepID=A0A7D5GN83_9EURY|nr:metal-dependent hydrolase [Halobaculum halophilum]QLG29207.1 metal-dependent hydrolase [Halobaculum halophilum]